MKKVFTQAVLVLSTLVLAATLAQASPYLTVKMGPYIPDHDAFETGYGIRAAFGMSFRDLGFGGEPRPGSWLDKLLIEAGFGYYTADVDRPGQSGDMRVLPLTISGVFTHTLPNVPLELRAGVGLGTYFAEFDSTVIDKSSVKQGLYLNAGAIYNLNEKLGILVDVDLDHASGDAGGWMLNGGMRYRF